MYYLSGDADPLARADIRPATGLASPDNVLQTLPIPQPGCIQILFRRFDYSQVAVVICNSDHCLTMQILSTLARAVLENFEDFNRGRAPVPGNSDHSVVYYISMF